MDLYQVIQIILGVIIALTGLLGLILSIIKLVLIHR